jgi:DNA-binding NtrC family response regulator
MTKSGPIVIIEDDSDDRELLSEVLKELSYPNEVIFFDSGDKAYDYLEKSECEVFIILSDINLPRLNGFALRDKLHSHVYLKLKCIPFIYFTTSARPDHVVDAYSRSIQGFFIKPNKYSELLRVAKNIIQYWQDCIDVNDAH